MATKSNVIEILDSQEGSIDISANKRYKLVNPDGKDIGGFWITGTPLVDSKDDGVVRLTNVPLTGEILFVDVNNRGGALTKIENKSGEREFTVTHPDLGKDPAVFTGYRDEVLDPKPFKVSWTYYDPAEKIDKKVTINITPLPIEHAIEIRFTIKQPR